MAVTPSTEPFARTVSSTELFKRWRHGRDERAREILIERFLPLARKLARRYSSSNEPYDDLVQVASLGLVKAVERFDPDRGFAFTSFAVPTIVGELKRYFRDTAWALHVDRSAQERARKIAEARREIAMTARAGADDRRAGRIPRVQRARRSSTGSRSARRSTPSRSTRRGPATATAPASRLEAIGDEDDRHGPDRRPGDDLRRGTAASAGGSERSCSCASART